MSVDPASCGSCTTGVHGQEMCQHSGCSRATLLVSPPTWVCMGIQTDSTPMMHRNHAYADMDVYFSHGFDVATMDATELVFMITANRIGYSFPKWVLPNSIATLFNSSTCHH